MKRWISLVLALCLGLSAAALFYLLLFRPRELGRELHKRFLL